MQIGEMLIKSEITLKNNSELTSLTDLYNNEAAFDIDIISSDIARKTNSISIFIKLYTYTFI